jgi:hypothetical protein
VDTFARTHAPPDVIKIDTEGFERSVLDGLGPHRPVVIAELHGNNTEVVEWLEGRGYAVMNLDGPEPPIAAGPVHVVAYPPS